MRFSCPFCYYAMNADDASRGYRTTCASCGKSILVPSSQFDEGSIIGDFILNTKIGEGSIGMVFKATQISLDRTVALKVISPEYITAKGAQDFLHEARAAARLSHTNLVQAYAVGEDNGIFYMAMTYINGETLKTRLKREIQIPVDEALHIVQQVAEALYYAWDEARLIHRDVKPDNIMLTEEGIVKLTDLGLVMNQADWHEGMEISGSPAYMSPEQLTGDKLDTRSDIYSLGITLYQMVTGQLPFNGENVKEISEQHFKSTPLPPTALLPELPREIDALIWKMIDKHPKDRFQDMEALLNEIWKIRQKTAPNKSLVPEIHTISAKRLDYNIQHESMAASHHVKRMEEEIKSRYDYMKLIFVIFPVLLILFVVLLLFFRSEISQSDQKLYRDVESFERFAADRSLPPQTIALEGESLLKSIPTKASVPNRYARAKVEGIILRLKLETLEESTFGLENEKKYLLAELDVAVRENSKQNEIIRDDISAMETIVFSTIALTPSERDSLLKIRRQVLKLRKQYDFDGIQDILNSLKGSVPETLSPWIALSIAENKELKEIYAKLTNSGTALAGAVFGNGSEVIRISNGKIHSMVSGTEHVQSWNELSSGILAEILRGYATDQGKPADILSLLDILKNDIAKALEHLSRSPDRTYYQLLQIDYICSLYNFLDSADTPDEPETETSSENLAE